MQVTVFKLVRENVCADSFTSQQFLTPENALEKARAKRDQLNNSELVRVTGIPYKIVRAFRQSTSRPL